MITLNTSNIPRYAIGATKNFYGELLDVYNYNVHSIYLTGEGFSLDDTVRKYNIEGIIMLKKIDDLFIKTAASITKIYQKKPLCVPLVMSVDEINSYIEIFPLKFLNHGLLHQTIYGDDLLQGLDISHQGLLTQCRQEVRAILNRLLRDYIVTGGDKIKTAKKIRDSFRENIPLFRGLIKLTGTIPPINHKDVIIALPGAAKISNAGIFNAIYNLNIKKLKNNKDYLENIFNEYYSVLMELDKKLKYSV